MTRSGRELILATKPFAQESRGRSWWHFWSTLTVLVGLLAATCLDISWMLRLPLSVMAALVLVRMFILYHDYLHGAILQRAWLADIIFRIYGLLLLTPPSIWKESHDHHHHHNGQYFGLRIGTFPLMTSDDYSHATRGQRLQYAIVRHPLVILFGYFTVFVYSMCLREFLAKPRRHFDAALALLLQSTLITVLSIFATGALVFTLLIPVMLASALGAYLFYAQHNFPTARFQDQTHWTYADAALHSSSYMRMNPVLDWFTGNIGYHHVHHLNSRIPFYRLPEAMAAIPELQSPGTTTLRPWDIYRCLRLKVWDSRKNRLITFTECRRQAAKVSHSQEREHLCKRHNKAIESSSIT